MVCAHIFITGDVLGVGFRSWTVWKAKNLGLFGWVKNVYQPREGVEAVFEGEKEKVEKMVELCKKGPIVSWVKNVKVEWEKATGEFKEFTIQR